MEINPNRNVNPVPPSVPSAKTKGTSGVGESETSFQQSEGLTSALSSVPDSRAELVARAEKLIASPSYPPPEMIKRIANLLAATLISGE